MPLNISTELKDHKAQTTTTLATCIEILLVDGSTKTYRFTDHDKPILYLGNTYTPTSGYIPSAADTKIDLSVDNLSIIGIIDDDALKYEDLLAGRFDYADVNIFEINYEDTTMGVFPILSGKIGEVTLQDKTFTAEIRALTQFFQQSLLEPYTVHCTADLGDHRCKVNMAPFTKTFTVDGVILGSENRIFTTDLTDVDDYFNLGLVTWSSGSTNEYFKMDVKKYINANGRIELYEPMPFDIQIGNTGTIQTGCDKKWDTCKNRYSNKLNYRGFIHLLGLLKTLRGGR